MLMVPLVRSAVTVCKVSRCLIVGEMLEVSLLSTQGPFLSISCLRGLLFLCFGLHSVATFLADLFGGLPAACAADLVSEQKACITMLSSCLGQAQALLRSGSGVFSLLSLSDCKDISECQKAAASKDNRYASCPYDIYQHT